MTHPAAYWPSVVGIPEPPDVSYSRADKRLSREVQQAATRFLAARRVQPMPTIVEYTNERAPLNEYPQRIVSPPRPSACCFTDRETLGEDTPEGRWVYRYKRCRTCGYTTRLIVAEVPQDQLIADLRGGLEAMFTREPLGSDCRRTSRAHSKRAEGAA